MEKLNNMDNTLTQQDIDQADKISGWKTPSPGAPAQTRSQELQAIRAKAKSANPIPEPIKIPTVGEDATNTINNAGAKVNADIQGTSPESQGEGGLVRGLQAAKEAGGGVLDLVGTLVKHLAGDKTNFSGSTDKPTLDKSGTDVKIQNTGPSPAFVDAVNNFTQSHPDAAKHLDSVLKGISATGSIAGDVATADLGVTGVEKTGAEAAQGIKDTAEATKGLPSPTTSDFYRKQSIKDWTKPSTVAKPSFNKAATIFKNAGDTNIPEVLVDNGVKLSDNIQDGKYATKDTADALREDAGKMSHDLLRPSLEAADYSTPKTPIEDIIKKAKNVVAKDKTITIGDRETALAKLEKEKLALQRSYPEGMSLTDMHDNKITYSKNAGHNPIGTRADNITANNNNAVATAMKKTIEEKAPEGVPVEEINKEFTKRYQAANYLEALHGKEVPKGLGSRIARTTAKVVGAVAGESIGGGILGGVGGYHLGGMLERFIENASNPIKAHFLNNLEKTNPEVFEKVRQYLGDTETERLMQKALPPASYIPMAGKAPNASTVEMIPAEKNLVTSNPKTGKFQRTYSSTPKK